MPSPLGLSPKLSPLRKIIPFIISRHGREPPSPKSLSWLRVGNLLSFPLKGSEFGAVPFCLCMFYECVCHRKPISLTKYTLKKV